MNGSTHVNRPPIVEGLSLSTTIQCPHCSNPIAIKDRKPGRFRVDCPRCASSFALTIAEDPNAPPVVASLGTTPATQARSVDPDETITQEIPRQLAAMVPRRPAVADETIEEVRATPGEFDPPFQPPRSLGGYRVGRQVGVFRAGITFEATRTATGRLLALAVVKPRWAAGATFVARFVREAYAAGQLDHPNLIAPADVDVVRGYAFAATGALDGLPLSDPRGREGMDRTARAAAILHAARALKQAHEQGLYHRDLSLAKIRVDGSGLVRLADLGVGLTPDTPEVPPIPPIPPIPLTGLPPTPSPPPASTAFVREDIAALGRSLHAMVGGQQMDRALTPGLASTIRRMTGEDAEGRFHDLGAVVRTLEAELGVEGEFLPRDEEAAELEAAARAFDETSLAKLRPRLVLGFAAVVGLFVALSIPAGRPLTALGALGFGAIVATSLVAVRGVSRRDPLFERARELLLGGGVGDRLTVGASVVLLSAALLATGLLGFWIFLGLLAVGLALAYHFAVDRPIEQARVEPIARATALIRSLRWLGISEDSVRRFACRQAGVRWEEFHEALFGYEALRKARVRWGLDAGGGRRPRFARGRDPIADFLDARIAARRRARDLVLFQAIEERNLEARGVNLLTARRKGRRIAEAIVAFAHQARRAGPDASGLPLMDALNRVAHRPEEFLTTLDDDDHPGPPAWRGALDLATRFLFGPRTRFLLGGALLAGFLLWMHQNELINADEIRRAGLNATTDREHAVDDARAIGRKVADKVQGVADARTETRSLEVGGLSPGVTRRLDGFGLGAAGLILILSSFFRGVRFAAFAVSGALVAALGPRLIEAGARPLGPTSLIAMAIGASLFALGVVFGRTRE